MAKFAFVPFAKNHSTAASNYVSEKAGEWRVVKDMTLKHAGLNAPLSKVKDGDTIYVQAEGYTNDLTGIGGPAGNPFLSPQKVLDALLAAGVVPGTQNLKIKIWACFSGFTFAHAFYQLAHGHFPNLIVDGYRGKTRLDGDKKVLGAVAVGNAIDQKRYDDDESLAKEVRVRYP